VHGHTDEQNENILLQTHYVRPRHKNISLAVTGHASIDVNHVPLHKSAVWPASNLFQYSSITFSYFTDWRSTECYLIEWTAKYIQE